MNVGVLALQGDFAEHQDALHELGVPSLLVRLPHQLELIDRLIIPGGESSTASKLLISSGLEKPLKKLIRSGLPVWGTCSGAILLARKIVAGAHEQRSLGSMNIVARRNAYGRQSESFETTLEMVGISKPVPAVFIRAPILEEPGDGVDVLATHNGHIVAAREGRILATCFHTELSSTVLHKYFLTL